MKNDLHKKIEDTLNSLDHIHPAEANPFLFSKILHRTRNKQQSVLPQQWGWRLTVVMAIVVLLNVFTIRSLVFDRQTDKGARSVATEYAISIPDTY